MCIRDSLRGAIIEKLVSEGFEVVVVGQLLEHQDKLKACLLYTSRCV